MYYLYKEFLQIHLITYILRIHVTYLELWWKVKILRIYPKLSIKEH